MDGCDKKMHLISFKNLFEIFIKSLHIEERVLLFYFILVENESFRVYVLSRTDQETIVKYYPIYFKTFFLLNKIYFFLYIVFTYTEIDL